MLKRKDVVYYARIQPSLGVYDVLELFVRTVEIDWFTGMDKDDKRVYLFDNNNLNKNVFTDRKEALKMVKEAEKNKKKMVFTIEEEWKWK